MIATALRNNCIGFVVGFYLTGHVASQMNEPMAKLEKQSVFWTVLQKD